MLFRSDEDLAALPVALREHFERRQRLGFNAAYGLYMGDTPVHVAWMVDARLDRLNRVRNVRLRRSEVEITHCLTDEAHRGRGLYPLAIRALCALAGSNGAERVYMITSIDNLSSQRGIEKAGLKRWGDIRRFFCPLAPSWLHATLRPGRHR